ncbi:hypothetical protein HDU97_003530 [Phlyctochytrium planicorne]|nr:hypothetical protein HDU97_003530 [Phlyctochytrium planicorne]
MARKRLSEFCSAFITVGSQHSFLDLTLQARQDHIISYLTLPLDLTLRDEIILKRLSTSPTLFTLLLPHPASQPEPSSDEVELTTAVGLGLCEDAKAVGNRPRTDSEVTLLNHDSYMESPSCTGCRHFEELAPSKSDAGKKGDFKAFEPLTPPPSPPNVRRPSELGNTAPDAKDIRERLERTFSPEVLFVPNDLPTVESVITVMSCLVNTTDILPVTQQSSDEASQAAHPSDGARAEMEDGAFESDSSESKPTSIKTDFLESGSDKDTPKSDGWDRSDDEKAAKSDASASLLQPFSASALSPRSFSQISFESNTVYSPGDDFRETPPLKVEFVADWTASTLSPETAIPILTRIFTYLDLNGLLLVESSCKLWKKAAQSSELWMKVCSSAPFSESRLALRVHSKQKLLTIKPWKKKAQKLASKMANNGCSSIFTVESRHHLPALSPGANRSIESIFGPGVAASSQHNLDFSAFFLSAHPTALCSFNLLSSHMVDGSNESLNQGSNIVRHIELSKALCSISPSVSDDWIAVNAWTPGLFQAGEKFYFHRLGQQTPVGALRRSSSVPKLDSLLSNRSNTTFGDISPGLLLDFPVEFGDTIAHLYENTFVVAFHSNYAVAGGANSADSSDSNQGTPTSQPSTPEPIRFSPRIRPRSLASLSRKSSMVSLSSNEDARRNPLPLLQAYSLSNDKSQPALLWSIPRDPTSSEPRIPYMASNGHLMAYLDHSVPSTPSQKFKEGIQNLVDGHESANIRIRSINRGGQEVGRLDFTSRHLWVRGMHMTDLFLIVVMVQANPGSGGIVDRHPALRNMLGGRGTGTVGTGRRSSGTNGGGPIDSSPPLSPFIMGIYSLLDLSTVAEFILYDVFVPVEGCRYGISADDNTGTISAWTHPPTSLQASLVAEGASERDIWPTLPALIRMQLKINSSEEADMKIYKRRAERFLLPNAGIGGGMRGDPGGMWVVYSDVDENKSNEQCVWLRRPC